MAEQSASETLAGGMRSGDTQTGLPHGHEAHHGRPQSWVVTALIITGFIVGGIALVIGPVWWLFWVGVGIVVIAGLMGAAVRIFDDWY